MSMFSSRKKLKTSIPKNLVMFSQLDSYGYVRWFLRANLWETSVLPAKNNGESCNSSKQIHVATGEFCLPFYRRCLRRISLPKEPGSGVTCKMSSMKSLDWWRNMQETAHMNGNNG